MKQQIQDTTRHAEANPSRNVRSRGIASLWVMLSVIVLFSFLALAIDTLYVVMVGQQLQVGADAASLAGAQKVQFDQDGARADAVTFALANTAAQDAIVVDSNTDNTSTGDVVLGVFDRSDQSFTATETSPNAVMVRARRSDDSPGGALPLLFSTMFGVNTANVERQAIAIAVSEPVGLGIVMLQPSGPDAIQHSGNADITVQGPVNVNSTSSQGLHHSGNGDFTASAFNITGDYQSSGNGDLIGPIETGVAPVPDPLADLPVPNPNDFPIISTEPFKVERRMTLNPGVYIGGIDISTDRTVTLNPGIYLILGKGFKASGNMTLIINNAMIYNGDGPDDNADQFVISSDATVQWTPPTSGPWEGISYFQQRNVSDKKVQISGNGGTNIEGTMYAKTAEVQLSGNGGTSFVGGAFVANSMQISGNGTLNIGDGGSAGPGNVEVFLVR